MSLKNTKTKQFTICNFAINNYCQFSFNDYISEEKLTKITYLTLCILKK